MSSWSVSANETGNYVNSKKNNGSSRIARGELRSDAKKEDLDEKVSK